MEFIHPSLFVIFNIREAVSQFPFSRRRAFNGKFRESFAMTERLQRRVLRPSLKCFESAKKPRRRKG